MQHFKKLSILLYIVTFNYHVVLRSESAERAAAVHPQVTTADRLLEARRRRDLTDSELSRFVRFLFPGSRQVTTAINIAHIHPGPLLFETNRSGSIINVLTAGR
jgi:hypothetical protein